MPISPVDMGAGGLEVSIQPYLDFEVEEEDGEGSEYLMHSMDGDFVFLMYVDNKDWMISYWKVIFTKIRLVGWRRLSR